jgi:flagellar export protein FliJ
MAYRFSLATLLRLREIAEEREERTLGQILQQIVQAKQRIETLRKQRVHLLALREADLQRQMAAAELHVSYGQIHSLERMQQQAREQLIKLEDLRLKQMKIYEEAHRNKELLAGMREDQRDLYRIQQTRQEQNIMDDNFASRRAMR